MKAIEKAMEDQARHNSSNWINVLMGKSRVTIDPYNYNVTVSTFRKQANKEGFKTSLWGEEVQLYR